MSFFRFMVTVFSLISAHENLLLTAPSDQNTNSSQILRFKRQSPSLCRLSEFQCTSGDRCISKYLMCDGPRDCLDGSDETSAVCGDLSCPSPTFRCSYGACINGDLRCNGKPDCGDGSDERGCSTESNPQLAPLSCSLREFQCSDKQCISRFDICDGFSNCKDGSDETSTLCMNVTCPSGSLQCDYGACVEQSAKCNGSKDCHDASDEHHCPEYTPPTVEVVTSNRSRCGDGIKPRSVYPLIVNGNATRQGEFPWMAALYLKNKTTNKWVHICGGVLITPHIVLTAAHCLFLESYAANFVVSSTTGQVAPNNIKVGLGKTSIDYDTDELNSKIVDVRAVQVPSTYVGSELSYIMDIGLLDLNTIVQVTPFIMPACVSWEKKYTVHMPSRLEGYVAGWGKTEDKKRSESLLSTKVITRNITDCREKCKKSRNLSHDKFCGDSTNGNEVAEGDSGGGLTVVKDGLHYVVGVVSTAVQCSDTLSVFTFTDISYAANLGWIEHFMDEWKR